MSWMTIQNRLVVNEKDIAVFPYPVLIAKEIQETIIVVLDIPNKEIFSNNAYGYVLSEKRLWQIETYYPQAPANDICILGISPMIVPGQVVFFTWIGVILYVELNSGKILKKVISK